MVEKGGIGFPTKATDAQRKYEASLAKVNKDKGDWIATRELLESLVTELDDIRAKNKVPIMGFPLYELKQILNSQGLITELGVAICDINARLVELEKTVSNLSLKIR